MTDQRRGPIARRLTEGAPLAPLLVLFGLNAVDELDRTAFAVLLPEVRDHFGLDTQGILSVIALVFVLSLALQPIIGFYADRFNRVRIAAVGALVWAGFSLFTGLAATVALLVVARAGSGVGKLVNDPTHNSLLADFYPPATRAKVYGFHRAANSVGYILGPLLGGLLAYFFGWRAPFLLFAPPTIVLVVLLAMFVREPVRGGHERSVMGADDEVVATEETPPSFGEAWRTCYQVKTLRRIWYSLPFLAAAFLGISALASIYYEDVFGLNEVQRGVVIAIVEPFQLVGILVGIPLAARLMRRDEGLALKMLAVAGALSAAFLALFAIAPVLWVAVAANVLSTAALGILTPGIVATVSLAIPPRARAMGFSIGSLYVMPGALILLVIGGLADGSGIRAGILVLVPVFLLGALVLASAGSFVREDIVKVRTAAVAQAQVLAARRRGEAKLLLVRDVDVAYDDVQVLFGVDFEIDEGEIVALLGTNGAGKSTLLRAISGLAEPRAGAVIFDGVDTTHAPPQEIAARGVVQVPGGKGVFPTLTVAENLRIAGWLYQRDQRYLRRATEEALDFFPVLRERLGQSAGDLSGGEQQMLTLAQAFIAKPRLLMIDELSLGLAPRIVGQLLEIVRAIRERGTTIILVEQSVNVALTVAETAYFMEKGEIRFRGPTSELLDRPDLLRSVFLEGGAGSVGGNGGLPGADTGAAAGLPVVTGLSLRRGPRDVARGAESGGAPVLEVEGVSRSFGGIVAVDGVSMTVRDGRVVGLIGPNGAGKTTLFDLISGYLVPDAGRVLLEGEDVTATTPDVRARLGLGRSFQDARLFPGLTVGETIAVALEREVEIRDPVASLLGTRGVVRSEARVARRADELVEMLGLGAFRDKFIGELSTGSRRIVDLACVVAQDPRVILFDEPSSGIAQREAEALGPLLLRIRDELGAGLVVIEHDMPLLTSIADEVVALDLGAVVTTGPPADVVRHPKVVASYLGDDGSVIARSGDATDTGSPRGKGAPASVRARRRAAPLRAGGRTRTANGRKRATEGTS